MTEGLFYALVVGTILNTLGLQFSIPFLPQAVATIGSGDATIAYTIAVLASALVDSSIAIGFSLNTPPLVLFSLIPVGFSANAIVAAGGRLCSCEFS